MSITEIQQAVTNLPKADYLQFQAWLSEYDNQRWDKEIEQDLKGGRLDTLINQTLDQIERGEYRAI
jgi:hypothetical protein